LSGDMPSDAFFENAENFALSRSEYLRMHRARRDRPKPLYGDS
jgi:hypothetical protein